MDILKYKEFEGTAELDMARHVCRGKLLFIDDLVTYESDSPGGLQREFESAVDDYIQTCMVIGKEPQRPFRGLFNVRVSPNLHRAAALRAMAESVSLNDVVVRAIDAFLNSRAEVNHNVKVTLEGPPRLMKTVQAAASTSVQWGTSNVH
jgi:predicted HicB family RNase H-like nuclease